jgi:HEAT repeat protein
MLSAYPSPDHEDLLLSLLEKGDEGWSRAAAMSLGHIGTRRSIEPVRKLVEIRAKQVDPKMVAEMTARWVILW